MRYKGIGGMERNMHNGYTKRDIERFLYTGVGKQGAKDRAVRALVTLVSEKGEAAYQLGFADGRAGKGPPEQTTAGEQARAFSAKYPNPDVMEEMSKLIWSLYVAGYYAGKPAGEVM